MHYPAAATDFASDCTERYHDMIRAEDKVYFEERERHARAVADRAASRRIRMIHEELASRYRGWALAAEFADTSIIVLDDRS